MGWSLPIRLPCTVTLAEDAEPQWPPMCVRCLRARPTGAHCFAARRSAWYELLAMPAFGSRPTVRVPACDSCASKVQSQRRRHRVFEVLCMIGVAVVAVGLLHQFGLAKHPLRLWMALPIALVAATPWLVAQACFP